MKRATGIAVLAAALAACLFITGCAQSAGSADSAITVSASASISVAPDKADFDILMNSQGDVEQGAADACMAKANEAIARLKTLGIADSNIQMGTVQVAPRYADVPVVEEVATGYFDWYGNWIDTGVQQLMSETMSQIVGYDAAMSVRVVGLDAVLIGTALRESAAAGASGFDGFLYYVSDCEAAYQQALAAAVGAAHTKAEALAGASSVYVGRVVNMVEESMAPAELSFAGDAVGLDVGDAATLDIQPATIPVEASVTVSYSIS